MSATNTKPQFGKGSEGKRLILMRVECTQFAGSGSQSRWPLWIKVSLVAPNQALS